MDYIFRPNLGRFWRRDPTLWLIFYLLQREDTSWARTQTTARAEKVSFKQRFSSAAQCQNFKNNKFVIFFYAKVENCQIYSGMLNISFIIPASASHTAWNFSHSTSLGIVVRGAPEMFPLPNLGFSPKVRTPTSKFFYVYFAC